MPWPDPETWPARLAASPLVGDDRPLHLEGTTLYLDRLWADEQLVAHDLLARAAVAAPDVDPEVLAAGLAACFDETGDARDTHDARDGDDDQRRAAATAVHRWVTVIAGGPGTGKTTTVAKVLALLADQAAAAGRRPPLVGLAAPTGKAAARLEEAVRAGVAELGPGPVTGARASLAALQGMTLHRLLGYNPGNRTRFRHDRDNRLPHDVVVVDETSMVSLSLMARLLEAVRPSARLVLVGDPEQLASVEAGAVLGDIAGPAVLGRRRRGRRRRCRHGLSGPARGAAPFGESVAVLRRVHRFGGAIADLAQAIRRGDADEVMAILEVGGPDVTWIVPDAAHPAAALSDVRAVAVERGRRVVELGACRRRRRAGHRRARQLPASVRPPAWARRRHHVDRAGDPVAQGGGRGIHRRPGLVRRAPADRDGERLRPAALQRRHRRGGGDGGGRLLAAFDRGGIVAEISPTRLAAVDTVYAMTVHKSQGSQYETVAFVVPAADSRVLTRELLYTAVTRAQERLYLVGSEESIRAAVERRIARASGLRRALWGTDA